MLNLLQTNEANFSIKERNIVYFSLFVIHIISPYFYIILLWEQFCHMLYEAVIWYLIQLKVLRTVV